ncbi:MAG: hypothetical protein AAB316_09295 [Bacteroidota bacterium]
MKNIFFFFVLLSSLIAACRSDTTSGDGQAEKSVETPQASETPMGAVLPETVKLVCQQISDPNAQEGAPPRHEVFLQLGEELKKIADINNCQPMTRDLFEQHKIPAEALSAVGGWWAGTGDYIYVALEGENYVVKQGSMDEAQADNSYGYKTVASYNQQGEQQL